MKIGFLLISNGWGGAEKVVYELCRNLLKSKMHILLLTNNEMVRYYSDISNLEIIDLGPRFKGNLISRINCIRKIRNNLKKIIAEEEIDVINLNLEGSFMFYFNLYKNEKPNLITLLHGIEIKEFFMTDLNWDRKLYTFFLKKALLNSKVI